MKFTLSSDQTSALIADGVAKALAAQGAAPQAAASPHFLPKGSKTAPSDLASKDARIVAAFARRGFKVTLWIGTIQKRHTMFGLTRLGSMSAELSERDNTEFVAYST